MTYVSLFSRLLAPLERHTRVENRERDELVTFLKNARRLATTPDEDATKHDTPRSHQVCCGLGGEQND